jgi:signal peptidase
VGAISVRSGFSLLAAAILMFLAGLMMWTLLPLAFGWSSSVVMTGSMAPAIEPGDVVVTSPPRAGMSPLGQVVRFRDPAQPGRFLLHRIVAVTDDGGLTSKGDANPTADSTPVPPANVMGYGRLRVPWVGRPVLWLRAGAYGKLGVLCLGLLGLCAAAGHSRLRPYQARHRRHPDAAPVGQSEEPAPELERKAA